jgi:PRC-barrel domain protein
MLHYITKLKGFHIMATDGDAGHVDDFLVDERLNVRHLVIDTSNWVGGQSVLISPAAVTNIDSPNKQIQVALSRDEIKNSPSVETADIELIETLPPPII